MFGEAWTSHTARGEKVRRFLFVCLSVMLSNDKVCDRHFAVNALKFKNDISIIEQGNVCRCAPVFNCLYNAGQSHHRMKNLKNG